MPGAYGNVFNLQTSLKRDPREARSSSRRARDTPLKQIRPFTSAINSTGVLLMSVLLSIS